VLLTLPLLALLAQQPPAAPAPAVPVAPSRDQSRDELGFGIGVARKGLWREARFRFERAVALDPGAATARNNLAIALEQEGAFERARAEYEAALRLDPDNLYIQQNYDLFREADDKRNRKKKKR
jgi:Flp pilus assembly protein TadD